MIIPINLESENSVQTTKRVPQSISSSVTTFPMIKKGKESQGKVVRFEDIIIPTFSKYFQLQNSHTNKFGSLLAKKYPLHIEGFKDEGDKYKLTIDVKKFKPEEIHVKITQQCISILGKHEDKIDELNYNSQEFFRKYTLPNEVDPDDIACEVRTDGYLVISAPKLTDKLKETLIPVRLTSSAICI